MNETLSPTLKKNKIALVGAIILMLSQLLHIIGASITWGNPDGLNVFLYVIDITLIVALAVVFIIKLNPIVRLSVAGANALWKMIWLIITGVKEGIDFLEDPYRMIAMIFEVLMFLTLVLLLLEDVGVSKIAKFKTLLKIALFLSGALVIVFNIVFYVDDFYRSEQILDYIAELLCCVGVILIGCYVLNPYVSPKADSTYSGHVAGKKSEFYVSITKHIFLLLLTFGIWYFVWIYKATKFTNLAKGEPQRGPGKKLLLCIFVPFYTIYWTYKTALRVNAIAKERGVISDLGTLIALAIFLPIIPPILLQSKISELTLVQPSEAE